MFSLSNLRFKTVTINFVQIFTGSKQDLSPMNLMYKPQLNILLFRAGFPWLAPVHEQSLHSWNNLCCARMYNLKNNLLSFSFGSLVWCHYSVAWSGRPPSLQHLEAEQSKEMENFLKR